MRDLGLLRRFSTTGKTRCAHHHCNQQKGSEQRTLWPVCLGDPSNHSLSCTAAEIGRLLRVRFKRILNERNGWLGSILKTKLYFQCA